MGEFAKRKYKTNIIITRCKLAVCTAIFLMSTTSLNVSAEVVGGTESVQEDTEISTADIESGVVDGEGESVESENSEAESTEEGSTEEGSTEEGSTEEGSTEEGSTEEGSTEEGSTEEGSTEEGSTEEESTEEGSTEEESTEEGSTEEESTEEGSAEEESTEESKTDQGAEELVPPPLENIVLTTMPDTRNAFEEALKIACEALGLICNGTSITGYDASKIGDVLEIPEGITTISGMARMPAAEVIFPASLLEIGSSCFMGSPNLRKISFKPGSQIYAIFMNAFYDCPNLETTDFSNADFVGHPSDGSIMVSSPFGGRISLKYIFFSQTGLENLKNKGGIRFFSALNQFDQFTLKTDGTVSSEAELCTFWKSGIADMVTFGLNLNNVKKAAVIFNGSEYDITKRLQTQNIAEAYIADNLGSQEQELLWSSCFTESTAKTATNLVNVSAVGSAADGLHYSSFAEFYKNLLKEGNKNDLTVELQNEIAGVFSSMVTTLVTKTQAIPKTVQDFNIDKVTVQKT